MATSFYSFWLIPQEPDLSHLQTIINKLASRFSTVSFCPHVTLYSGFLSLSLRAQQIYSAQAASGPIELEVVNLDHEARFSKTLYIQLRSSPALEQLVHDLVAVIPDALAPALDPHVSLLYHSLDRHTKEALIKAITLPRPTIQFNQVQIIAAPQNFETQAHVSRLRHVHSQFLSPP